MKKRNSIILLLVISALIGYILCSIYIFYLGFEILENGKLPEKYHEKLNPALTYITSGLMGLVGGIVATAFGVKKPDVPAPIPMTSKGYKMVNLGSFTSNTDNESTKKKLGEIYAFAYVGIGILSIIVWVILNNNALDAISNMATTFFGMAIPIIAKFFSTDNQ
ncbi:MAG: hypothetical protein ACPG4Y_05925 [Chitinophagales bacterium]